MSNPYFQFKQFTVWHNKCAMKVSTDGVILGAWVNAGNESRILDIGTGSGLLSLMLAQKSSGFIDSIDIDKTAIEQASENVKRSPWQDKISLEHTSFQEYVKTCQKKYDLIISNPPFFENSLKSFNHQRNIARHNDSLPFEILIKGVTKLLDRNGRFCLILPYVDAQVFIVDGALHYLYCNKKTMIKPSIRKRISRVLLEFSFVRSKVEENEFSILNNENLFSDEYINLTRDYYLNF